MDPADPIADDDLWNQLVEVYGADAENVPMYAALWQHLTYWLAERGALALLASDDGDGGSMH